MIAATSAGSPCVRRSGMGCEADSQELSDHLLAGAALERGVAGQRTEQRRAQRIHVRCRRRRRALEHFRRGERRRTGDHPVAVSKPPAILAIPKSVSCGSP